MRFRLFATGLFAALAAAVILAACGGGGGGSDSGKDPAEAAPPDSSVFVNGLIRPEGDIAANIDSLAKKVAGVDNLGKLLIEETEKSALGEGEKFDFAKEVEPWLGEEVAVFLHDYDGENFKSVGFAIQVEDEGAAEGFIEDHLQADNGEKEEVAEESSFEGVDLKSSSDGTTFAATEGLLLVGETEATVKESISALDGENLASSDSFTETTADEPDSSLANIYVNIGSLIEEAGQGIDSETEAGLAILGIEPKGSTALISLVPGSDNVEIDVSSNLGTGTATGGNASDLLSSLPSGSVVAFATSEFGSALEEAINRIDEEGIPGQVPPHQFKKALSQSGVDIESIVGSLGDLGFFVEGTSEQNLAGALVIESKNATEAQNTVKNLGLLLRASGAPGVTAINEAGVTGFSIPNDELGGQPIVVAVSGGKIAISLGVKAAAAALSGKAGTLGDDPNFKEAETALGDTPISGYVSGKSALTLIEAVSSPLESEELTQAKPYLEKVSYLAIGGESSGDKSSAKLILGFTE